MDLVTGRQEEVRLDLATDHLEPQGFYDENGSIVGGKSLDAQYFLMMRDMYSGARNSRLPNNGANQV
jgi:hypothetical protein